jgi:hypothetical protein
MMESPLSVFVPSKLDQHRVELPAERSLMFAQQLCMLLSEGFAGIRAHLERSNKERAS